jgi:hypothetical protein
VNDQALSVLVLTDEASASSKLWTGLIKLQRINLPASHDSFSRFGRAREEIVPKSQVLQLRSLCKNRSEEILILFQLQMLDRAFGWVF